MIYWKLVGREPVMGLRGLENCLGLEYNIVLLVRVLPEMNHEHATRLGLARFSYLLRQLVRMGHRCPTQIVVVLCSGVIENIQYSCLAHILNEAFRNQVMLAIQ